MSELTIETVQTADANVVRFHTNKTLNPFGPKAFYDADSAQSDTVAADFFAIDGVKGLMIVNEFCAVHKEDAAQWDALNPGIEAVIRSHWTEGNPYAS